MRMLYQRNRNGLDYCSSNVNCAKKPLWQWFRERKHAGTVPQYRNMMARFDRNSSRIDHWKENMQNWDRKYNNSGQILIKITFFWHQYPPCSDRQCCALYQWWGRDVRNTGGDKYETTSREIQNDQIGAFRGKWKMTFRKVTPTALKVNDPLLLGPWHVWAPIWMRFAPWGSIFPVKNWFSHIFPAPEGSPFLTVILTVKLARLVYMAVHNLVTWMCITRR